MSLFLKTLNRFLVELSITMALQLIPAGLRLKNEEKLLAEGLAGYVAIHDVFAIA